MTRVRYIVPPGCQGQPVEHSYSIAPDADGWLYRRVYDRSDSSERLYRVHVDSGVGEWRPWSEEPRGIDWGIGQPVSWSHQWVRP
jgi:hypothetical protein